MSTHTRTMLIASLGATAPDAAHKARQLAARGCRELYAAVEAGDDFLQALDRACQHNPEIADRVNLVPGQDGLEGILRSLRKIALDFDAHEQERSANPDAMLAAL